MKNLLKLLLPILFVLISFSCQKEKVFKYPSINFIGGENLISQNSVLKPNMNFRVGISSFTNDDSKLYKFRVTRISENDPQIILDSTININMFNAVITFPTSSEENLERWIFEISSESGYSSRTSLLIKTSANDSSNISKNNASQTNFILTDLPNNPYSDIPIYASLFVLLILGIIIFLIKKPKKVREYNFVKLEQINQIKEDILKRMKEQEDNFLNIEKFINNKIDDYQKQIDKLKENKDNRFSAKNIIVYVLIAVYLTSFLIIMRILG